MLSKHLARISSQKIYQIRFLAVLAFQAELSVSINFLDQMLREKIHFFVRSSNSTAMSDFTKVRQLRDVAPLDWFPHYDIHVAIQRHQSYCLKSNQRVLSSFFIIKRINLQCQIPQGHSPRGTVGLRRANLSCLYKSLFHM